MATLSKPTPSTETSSHPVNRLLASSAVLNWEAIAYIVILIIAVFTRFYALGDRVMSHDESLHTRYSYNLYANGDFQHTPLMHGPILFHAVAFFYYMFGDNDFTARIYAALLGIGLVMFPFLFRRWLGRTGALLASIMILISPLLMYYNRYIREDTPSIFFTIIMVYCTFMYLDGPPQRRRKGYWLYIFAAAMLGSLASKESAFMYIAIFGSFMTLYWLVRLAQQLWRIPGRTWFNLLCLGTLVAGVAALGMYVVLSVAPLPKVTESARLAGGWFNSLDSSSFILWTLIVVITVLVFVIGTLLWAFRSSRTPIRWVDLAALLAVAVVVCLGLIIVEEASHIAPRDSSEHAAPLVPGEGAAATEAIARTWPVIVWWIVCALIVLIVLMSWRLGWWRHLHRLPEFDILVVMGTLVLPWLTPFITKLAGWSPVDYSNEGIGRALLSLIPAFAVSAVLGLVWNWRRWLICVVVFHALFAFFFTTMFTNLNGLATGMVGSLGYWLEQQSVRRGSQPQYYYLILIMPFYEFLPIIGSFLAMLTGLTLFWKGRQAALEKQKNTTSMIDLTDSAPPQTDDELGFVSVRQAGSDPALYESSIGNLMESREQTPLAAEAPASGPVRRLLVVERITRIPFLLFVSWWAIFNLVAYTLAGEKMPWLGTHMTFPLIFLAAWYFGRLFERIDWQPFRVGGWVYLLLFPALFVTLFQVLQPFFTGPGPFAGLQQAQLANSGRWLAVVAVSGLIILMIYQLIERTGWRHLRQMFAVAVFLVLGLLTTRSALLASFINYDLASEYLVYAHGAPAIKTVLNEIERISLQTADGKALQFSYDNETSWPYSWYFRDYPNAVFFGSSPTRPIIDKSVVVVAGEANRRAVEPLLEDRFYHFEYIRLWWPMQDYFNLTPERINSALDFSPENVQAQQLRQGLWDIWWERNYRTYGEAVGRDFDITRWPVADRMHFYVRKDVAAQIWSLGVGEGTVENPLNVLEVNVCNQNWQPLIAEQVIGGEGTGEGQLNRPLGMAIGADGRLYAAEEVNNRVSVFDSLGGFAETLTGGSVVFARPNGVALAANGNIYVADTWNYRIQAFSSDGEFITNWGQRGEFGLTAQTEPTDGFWGPRAVAVDGLGQVYVADTGNKRIRVYTPSGEFVRDIGSGGSGPGQLDEPVGMVIHPDGRLFVADTWNRRISVFNTQDGAYLYSFNVRGWYDELGNRPYVALDPARSLVYVTDPDAGRVLVYDTTGNCQGSFGQPSRENPDASQFRTVGGIAVDSAGYVFVADAGSGRILKFAPFVPPVVPAVIPNAEATVETTPEVQAAG